MNKLLEKTSQFVFSKQKTIFSSAMILASMIVVSRFFGFLRYRILVSYFSKEELDIFFASFRIPDLIFELLITGAFTSSFIPVFLKYQQQKDHLDEHISSIINFILLAMVVVIGILLIFLDQIVLLIAPGFNSAKNAQIIFYSRLLLLIQLPLLIAGNIFTGIGQANKTFFLTAIAPIVYNLAIIAFTWFFSSQLSLLAPVLGVLVGSFLFTLIQIPLFFGSFHFTLVLKRTAAVIEFMRMTIPRMVTVMVAQIDTTIDLTLATLLGGGSYTIFYLAQHLQLLPVSVIGVAFGQASLPYLTEMYQQKRIEEFRKIIIDTVLSLFFFTIPIMSFFMFARTPLIRLFFGGQKFDWEATVATALTLSYFALSLPFHTIYYFLSRCFYAFLDTKTPFFISVFSVLLNSLMSVVFIVLLKYPVWSLAIAFSFSMIVNVVLLSLFLSVKLHGLDFVFLIVESTKMLVATFCSSLFSYYVMKLLDGLVFDTSRTINVFFLLVVVGGVYFLLYLFLTWFFNVKEVYLVAKLILKAKEYQKKILEIYSSYE